MTTNKRFSICILTNIRNEILLLKRAQSASLGPGKWGFPAGHIEAGESPAACAVRELREEIGTDYSVEWLRSIGPLRDTLYGGDFELYLFHGRWLGGLIRLNAEHTEFAWVGVECYREFDVMDGIDEDLAWLGIWPLALLNGSKLPPRFRKLTSDAG